MNEGQLEKKWRKEMQRFCKDHKHRDLQSGVPDISFTLNGGRLDGWIEFKVMKIPARWYTVPKTKWTAEQRLWLRQRGEAGGACFVVLGLGVKVLLLWWEDALRSINLVNSQTLLSVASYVWDNRAMLGGGKISLELLRTRKEKGTQWVT